MPGREREWSGAAERPWYTKGIERAERSRPAAGAPRRRWRAEEAWREGDEWPERRRSSRAVESRHPAREWPPYEEEYRTYGDDYWARGGEFWTRYGPEFTARRRFRTRGWNRARYVPASEVPRGRRERWWYAIGPERRMDYDWAYSARRPERYGWTGETGRDGGPGVGPGGRWAGGRRRGRDGGRWMRRRRRWAW